MDNNQLNNYNPYPYGPHNMNDPLMNRTNGFAIASLILGIFSIPLVCCYWIGACPGILAIVFAFVSKSKSYSKDGKMNGMAVAGLVLGIICLVLCVIYLLLFVLGIYTINSLKITEQYNRYF